MLHILSYVPFLSILHGWLALWEVRIRNGQLLQFPLRVAPLLLLLVWMDGGEMSDRSLSGRGRDLDHSHSSLWHYLSSHCLKKGGVCYPVSPDLSGPNTLMPLMSLAYGLLFLDFFKGICWIGVIGLPIALTVCLHQHH